MLEDYKKAVISNYHKKKEKGLLSSDLSTPTPAKLRDQCLKVLASRYNKKDEAFIKDFFNHNVEVSDYSQSIKRFDADRFRPLVRFMRRQIEDTADRNIELLAWLIDFEPRPYKFGVEYPICDVSVPADHIKEIDEPVRDEAAEAIFKPQSTSILSVIPYTPSNVKWINRPLTKRIISAVMLVFLITGGIYMYGQSTQVYVCDRGAGDRYHLSSKCPALKICKNSFVQTTIVEAEKNGKTLCSWEK